MAVAAFAVGVLALLVSVAAAGYARSQARSAKAALATVTRRRHHDRTPTLRVAPLMDERVDRLVPVFITNTSGVDLAEVRMTSIAGEVSPSALDGVWDTACGAARPSADLGGPLRAGASTGHFVVLRDLSLVARPTALLRFDVADGDGERWPITCEVEFTPTGSG